MNSEMQTSPKKQKNSETQVTPKKTSVWSDARVDDSPLTRAMISKAEEIKRDVEKRRWMRDQLNK